MRIDKLLCDRGLAPSRERAQSLVLAGKVLVNEQKIEKPGAAVADTAKLRLLGGDFPYVSRGGVKLEAALRCWNITVRGATCLDIGASTGGFTDCLLQHGAARVIAVDTGYGQLDFRLRQDSRVRLLERTNARYLRPADIPELMDLIVVDVSFISATLILPVVLRACALRPPARNLEVVTLVKPQFEAGRGQVGKGGVLRDPTLQLAAVDKVAACLRELGAAQIDFVESPILGKEGNREFLLYARFDETRR